MPRPKLPHPTPGELEILQILWNSGPATVRTVLEKLEETDRGRAYTSVMSLMNVMEEKGLLDRRPHGRAFVYRARVKEDAALGKLVRDLWGRAFDQSASTLVSRLLDETNPSEEEMKAIRAAISDYEGRVES